MNFTASSWFLPMNEILVSSTWLLFLACNPEVTDFNLGWDIDSPEACRGIPQSLPANSEILHLN
jgi:hypothetical protein